MDPFKLLEEELNTSFNSNLIIQTQQRGRKTNTFLAGWNISKEVLKEHLKNLKRKHGCNGSIKTTIISGIEYDNCLHLQGNQINNIVDYLKEQGMNTNNIEIKQV